MHTFKRSLAVITIVLLSVVTFTPMVGVAEEHSFGERRYIIVFENESAYRSAAVSLSQAGDTLYDLESFHMRVVSVRHPAALRALAQLPGVKRIEEDVLVYALFHNTVQVQAQTMPWGVDRIDAEKVWVAPAASSTGAGVKVAVIDTGIDKTHPDLVANIKGGRNFVRKSFFRPADPNAWNDDNGHGTHVAGTIAAVNNASGVVGVALNAHLYGVKALDKNGSGYLSDVIAGIDWAIANNMAVINMSLGTNSDVQSFHDAVDRAYAAGIVVVAAAGNDGDTNPDNDVDYPARYSSVIAVAATNSSDQRASWSSDGPEVAIAAPGVSIYSTWKGGSYATISGTSMATPHVAGSAALVLAAPVRPVYDTNSNGVWNVDEVRAVLTATADDLGTAGLDPYYGNGLVDAEEAATGVASLP